MPEPSDTRCPSCGAEFASNAVLCVACGYHTQLGFHLTTSVEKEPRLPLQVDSNPYASPHAVEDSTTNVANSDLTPETVDQVEAVIRAAGTVRTVGCLLCLCMPVWFAVLPWYGYQLWNWFRLYRTHEELRVANSLSPHSKLVIEFQDARLPLIVGVLVGLWICGLMAMSYVVRAWLRYASVS